MFSAYSLYVQCVAQLKWYFGNCPQLFYSYIYILLYFSLLWNLNSKGIVFNLSGFSGSRWCVYCSDTRSHFGDLVCNTGNKSCAIVQTFGMNPFRGLWPLLNYGMIPLFVQHGIVSPALQKCTAFDHYHVFKHFKNHVGKTRHYRESYES